MATFRFTNQYSDNPKKIIEFYRDVIGLREYGKYSEGSNWHSFMESTSQFAVEPSSNREENMQKYTANWQNPYLIQIEVESLDEMKEIIERAKDADVAVLSEFEKRSYGTVSKLLDPDNNMIELLFGWGSSEQQ